MLHCSGGAFYVGHTDDLELRMTQHETGLGSEFTKARLPVKLVWSEAFSIRGEALEMERRIKGWSRAKKMALIRSDWAELQHLAQSRDKNYPSTSSGRSE